VSAVPTAAAKPGVTDCDTVTADSVTTTNVAAAATGGSHCAGCQCGRAEHDRSSEHNHLLGQVCGQVFEQVFEHGSRSNCGLDSKQVRNFVMKTRSRSPRRMSSEQGW
jgi:hypothetical protein